MGPVGMLVLAMTAATGAVLSAVPVETGGGFYVDLANLQWWQTLIGVAGALGLSPIPWITALARGLLLWRSDFERQLAAKDKEHAKVVAQIEKNYEALRKLDAERYGELKETNALNVAVAQQERQRADDLTESVMGGVGTVLEANVHALGSFHKAAEIMREETVGHD